MVFVRSIRRRVGRLWHIILCIFFLSLLNIILKVLLFNPSQLPDCSQLCSCSSQAINDTLQFDSSHIIRHFPNFVCPQNFRNLADWVYGWPDQFDERLEKTTTDAKSIAPCLPPGSIIYVCIWAIGEFFDKVYPHLKNDFVLITGEGDLSSPDNIEHLEGPGSKIIHWFGQNGQYDASRSKKFTHIPIGINCYEMADAIQTIYSKQPSYTLPPIFNETDEPPHYILPSDVAHRALTTAIPKKNLLLINFDTHTDWSHLRFHIWTNSCLPKHRQKYTYLRCFGKEAGVQMKDLSRIYERNREYPFWLSPRGNGIDCHRTWEALYLDIIPIVWNSSLNVLYENLPVVIINDYKEVNEKFLYKKLDEISRKKLSKEKIYQYEKLRNAYWRRLILDKSRHGGKKSVHERRNQCWRAKLVTGWKRFIPFVYI